MSSLSLGVHTTFRFSGLPGFVASSGVGVTLHPASRKSSFQRQILCRHVRMSPVVVAGVIISIVSGGDRAWRSLRSLPLFYNPRGRGSHGEVSAFNAINIYHHIIIDVINVYEHPWKKDMIIYDHTIIPVDHVAGSMGASETSQNQTQPASFGAINQHLGDRREELLAELNPPDYADAGEDWDPRYTTAELRAETSVPQGSAIHHLERLLDWGLVKEHDDRAFDAQSGRETRVWEISERGMAFCDDHIDEEDTVSPEAFAALKTRVSSLEQEVAQRDEQLASQRRMVKWIVKKSDLFTSEEKEKILDGDSVE